MWRRWLTPYSFAIAVLTGVPIGLGAFTFFFGEGISYFSTNPTACVNCHIMNAEYDSWQKSGHHQVAVCVDCHLPHDFVRKYVAKADHGFWHSKGFTLQDFHEPIRMKERSARHVQENCVRCHSDFVHDIVRGSKEATENAVQCVHCHRGAGHGT